MNGFYETRLDILLRGLGADKLIITGAWTNMSIEHTARHGADAGYEVVVASDGTSTTGEEWQNAALNYAMTNVAKVATCAEIKAALGRDRAAERPPRAPGLHRRRLGGRRRRPTFDVRDPATGEVVGRGAAHGRRRDAARDRGRAARAAGLARLLAKERAADPAPLGRPDAGRPTTWPRC